MAVLFYSFYMLRDGNILQVLITSIVVNLEDSMADQKKRNKNKEKIFFD